MHPTQVWVVVTMVFEVEIGGKLVSAKSAKRTKLTDFRPNSTLKNRVETTQTRVGWKTRPITYCLSDNQNKFFVILTKGVSSERNVWNLYKSEYASREYN